MCVCGNDDVVPRLQVCQMGRASTVITAENVIQQARNGNTQLGVPAETAGSPTISPSGGRYSRKRYIAHSRSVCIRSALLDTRQGFGLGRGGVAENRGDRGGIREGRAEGEGGIGTIGGELLLERRAWWGARGGGKWHALGAMT